MTARDTILAAIRAGLGGPRRPLSAIAAEAAALLDDPGAIRPRLAGATLAEAFSTKAAAVGATIDRVAGPDAVPAAVGRYLAANGLPASVALQPARFGAGLAWGGIGTHASLAPDEPVAVGFAEWGIAESGSVVVHSAPDTAVLLAFLPLHHIVVLQTAHILPYLEDYAAVVAQAGAAPRNSVLITGPSGTTDIEGSYVRGAHGPGFVHVILADDRSGA